VLAPGHDLLVPDLLPLGVPQGGSGPLGTSRSTRAGDPEAAARNRAPDTGGMVAQTPYKAHVRLQARPGALG
jgi:hypothetical protein